MTERGFISQLHKLVGGLRLANLPFVEVAETDFLPERGTGLPSCHNMLVAFTVMNMVTRTSLIIFLIRAPSIGYL